MAQGDSKSLATCFYLRRSINLASVCSAEPKFVRHTEGRTRGKCSRGNALLDSR
jgi:hypothetical protein